MSACRENPVVKRHSLRGRIIASGVPAETLWVVVPPAEEMLGNSHMANVEMSQLADAWQRCM
jgi:hypothetical protein